MLTFTYSRTEKKYSKKGKQKVKITDICPNKHSKQIQRTEKYHFNNKT